MPLARRLSAALLVVVATSAAHAQQAVRERVALVVGNSAYRSAPLVNPRNDARAMTQLLRRAGFEVDEHVDTSQAELTAAITRFGDAIRNPQVKFGLFYYAGHGLQQDWRNYLVPVTARIARPEDVPRETVDVSTLLAYMSQAQGRNFLVILDACRDDPFAGSYRPVLKGLSQFDAPVGSLLAYATAPGNVAMDGEGDNGLYTSSLLQEFAVPGVKVEDAFKRVRLSVRLASKGRQVPWESTSLEEDVYLFPQQRRKLTEQEQEKLLDDEMAAWANVRSSSDIQKLAHFIRTHPSGYASELAQARLNRLLAAQARAQAEAEAQRVAQEEQRKRAEEERRRVAEEARRAEEIRIAQETARREAEIARRAEEEARRQAEIARVAQEEARRQAEVARLRAEAERVALEDARRKAEAERQAQAERERLAAEERARAEQQRLAAEQRQREEQQRLAEQRQREEAARVAAQRAREEQERIAAEQRQRDEQQRLAAEQRQREEAARLAAQRAREEQERIAAAAAERAQEEAARQAEAERIARAEQARQAEARRQAEQREAELAVARAEAERRQREAAQAAALAAAAPVAPVTVAALQPTPFSQGFVEHQRSYAVGDTFTYRVVDGLTKNATPLVYKVTAVDAEGDRVEFNGGEYLSDLMGNIFTNSRGVFSNPRQFYPAELYVGKRWKTMFRQQRPNGIVYTFEYSVKVVGREKVTVPAGTFEAYRIEATGFNIQRRASLSRTIWVAPGVAADIAHEIVVRLNNGMIEQYDRQELVSVTGGQASATR